MSRLIACVIVVAFAGSALATPPEIVEAELQNDALLLTVCQQVPVEKAVTVEVIENGVKVQKVRKVTVYESVSIVQKVSLADVKAMTAAGRPIPTNRLNEYLKEKRFVVVSRDGEVPEEYRKLFKEDVPILVIGMPGKDAPKK